MAKFRSGEIWLLAYIDHSITSVVDRYTCFQEKEMKLATSIIKSHMHMNHGLDKSCDKHKL